MDFADGKQKNYTIRSYVISEYLDNHVDTERGDFTLPQVDNDLFSSISVERIEREASNITKMFFNEYIQEKFQAKKQKVMDYVSSIAPWNKNLLKDLDMEASP